MKLHASFYWARPCVHENFVRDGPMVVYPNWPLFHGSLIKNWGKLDPLFCVWTMRRIRSTGQEGYNKYKGDGRVGTSKRNEYLSMHNKYLHPSHTPLFCFSRKRTCNEWPSVLGRAGAPAQIDQHTFKYIKQCESHAFCHIPALNQLPLGTLAS